MLISFRSIVVWSLLVFSCGSALAADAATGEAPYLIRGKQTELRQRALKDRLDRFHAALVEVLKRNAPDLLPSLEPPPPSVAGYQLLPRIIADPPLGPPVKPQVISYHWNWSDTLIAQEMASLDRLEADLTKLQPPALPVKKSAYESVVNGYKKVIDNRRMIDSDIDYNWIWQAAIARDRPGFDQITKRLDEVAELQKQGKPLTPDIIAAMGVANPPAFVRIESPADHQRLIIVPCYTDITDVKFVQKIKQAVEGAWQGRVGQDEIRVRLDIQTITPLSLYPNHSPPRKGEQIDVDAHVTHFPKDHVLFTTGAASLRIAAGPALVVAPHDITPHVFAHEFGHILGFPDAYFRGYRDLGVDGFQVMELVVDSEDILSNPSSGVVLPRHLEVLTNALDARGFMQAGLDALYRRNDPSAAVVQFRNVLDRNPTHYGAMLQLAKALDGAGNPWNALIWWKKVADVAKTIGDAETLATAKARLSFLCDQGKLGFASRYFCQGVKNI